MNTETAIQKLRGLEPDLRARGIAHLSLFGSRARGSATRESDFDLAVKFEPDLRMGGFEFGEIIHRFEQMLGSSVDVVIEPTRKRYLQSEIDRDRKRVF